MSSDLADLVIPFTYRFVWGELPFRELSAYLGARSEEQSSGYHWSLYVNRRNAESKKRLDLSLVEFCQSYDTIELWFDPHPNDQLLLVWLLDHFHAHPEIASKLRLRLVDFYLITPNVEELRGWRVHDVAVTKAELETASISWQAYRSPTPEACFGLLSRDLSALPLLRPALVDLVSELPSAATGLGATEMRLLVMLARGYDHTNQLFHLRGMRRTRIFREFEIGYLLDGLALGPRPAVAGLDEAIRTLSRENYPSRQEAYLRSRLSPTEFGKAVLAHKEDFSRHNPIDRWWGGTHLTNDRLWRWNPALIKPSRRPSERGVP